jgi:large subunit ribosomal protein L25
MPGPMATKTSTKSKQGELTLSAEPRSGAGKGEARKLRASGRVPAVLYGHGSDAKAIAVDARELSHILHTGAGGNVLVDLRFDGENHLAMPREIQRDAVRGSIFHVDFLEVRRDEKIAVDVPIRLVGESVGVKAGGVIEHHLWDLHVECLPGEVPEGIEVDVTPLEVGSSVRVADITVPSGVTVLTNPDETILSVVVPQARVTEEEEAAAAEAEAAEAEAAEEGAEGATAEEGEAAERRAEGE